MTFLGCFFSIAFKSVDMAIAYLVPFDVALMITSGVFIRISWVSFNIFPRLNVWWWFSFYFTKFDPFRSIPLVLSWLKYISWLKYANEAMTIVQWQGVSNISIQFYSITPKKKQEHSKTFFFFQHAISKLNFRAWNQPKTYWVNMISLKRTWMLIFMHWLFCI